MHDEDPKPISKLDKLVTYIKKLLFPKTVKWGENAEIRKPKRLSVWGLHILVYGSFTILKVRSSCDQKYSLYTIICFLRHFSALLTLEEMIFITQDLYSEKSHHDSILHRLSWNKNERRKFVKHGSFKFVQMISKSLIQALIKNQWILLC